MFQGFAASQLIGRVWVQKGFKVYGSVLCCVSSFCRDWKVACSLLGSLGHLGMCVSLFHAERSVDMPDRTLTGRLAILYSFSQALHCR